MTLAYNTGPGGLMYAPARDFAYNYPQMIACMRNAFSDKYWPALTDVLMTGACYDRPSDESTAAELIWDGLCEANDAYANFLNICCQDPDESFEQVLVRSGWKEVPDFAKVGWFAMMGQIMSGQIFQGLRDITVAGATAPSCMADLLRSGHESRRLNSNPGVSSEKEQAELLRCLTAQVSTLRTMGVGADQIKKAFSDAMTQ